MPNQSEKGNSHLILVLFIKIQEEVTLCMQTSFFNSPPLGCRVIEYSKEIKCSDNQEILKSLN